MTDQTDTGQPTTYRAAEHRYGPAAITAALMAARARYEDLADRRLAADTVARLRDRGEFDPADAGHALLAEREPLSAADHLEYLSLGEVLARYYRHPSDVDRAARAGATWEQIAEARGTDEATVRQAYREWLDGQRRLAEVSRLGMSEQEYAAGLARLEGGSAPLESAGLAQLAAYVDQAEG